MARMTGLPPFKTYGFGSPLRWKNRTNFREFISAMKQSVKIRKFERMDSEGVSKLRKAFPLAGSRRSVAAQYYAWKYLDNPYEEPEAWVAEDAGRVISILGAVPKKLKVGNKEFVVAEFVDAFTDISYQKRGILASLADKVLEGLKKKQIHYIYQTPNEVAYNYWTRKFSFYEPFKAERILVPLKLGNIVKALGTPQIKSQILLNIAVWLGNLLPTGLPALKGKTRECIELEQVYSFDERVDELWNRNKNDYEILLTRDSEYLNWRYVRNPDEYYLYLAKQGTEVVGVLVLKEGSIRGLKFGYISDIFCKRQPVIIRCVLDNAVRILKMKGIDIIEAWATPGGYYLNNLRRLSWIHWTRKQHFLTRSNFLEKTTDSKLEHPYEWLFNMSDTDNI